MVLELCMWGYMVDFPVWWDKTITHYKRLENANGEISYQILEYSKCSFVSKTEQRIIGNDSKTVKVCIVRIPEKVNVKINDIIVLGTVEDEISEYEPGQRSSDLLVKYDDSFIVDYVGDNDLLPHTKVQGDRV